MTGKMWLQVRLGLIAVAFVVFLLVPIHPFHPLRQAPSWALWVAGAMMVVGIFMMPLMLLAIFAIQAVNPFTDKVWTRPTHRSNPFYFRNPLLFFHFGAYFCGAGGLGLLVSALWNGLPAMIGGIVVILGSLAVLLGVRLGMRLFKGKMAPAQ